MLYLDSREKGYLQAAGRSPCAGGRSRRRHRERPSLSGRHTGRARGAGTPHRVRDPEGAAAAGPLLVSASGTGRQHDPVPFGRWRPLRLRPAGRTRRRSRSPLPTSPGKERRRPCSLRSCRACCPAESDAVDSPAQVCTRLNRSLCRRAVASRFVTVFYGQLNADNSFRYCNAGHNAPFLVTSTELIRLEIGGTVVGLFDFSEYECGETPFSAWRSAGHLQRRTDRSGQPGRG